MLSSPLDVFIAVRHKKYETYTMSGQLINADGSGNSTHVTEHDLFTYLLKTD